MTTTPLFNRLVRIPSTSYTAHKPVSVLAAQIARSNLQMLIAESAQMRFYYAAPIVTEAWTIDLYGVNNTGSTIIINDLSIPFIHSWIHPRYPTGLEIIVTTAGSDDIGLSARVVPASHPVGDQSAPKVFGGTALLTSPATEATVQGLVFFDTEIDQGGIFQEFSVLEDGVIRAPRVAMMRLDIQHTIPNGEYGYLTEIMIREFACLPT